MADIDLRIIGDTMVMRAVNALEKKMARRFVKTAMRAAGKVALAESIARVPVDTGRLRDSLHIVNKIGVRGLTGVKIESGKREELGIASDAKYYYPAIVEYRQKSYLRAAIDENHARLVSLIRSSLKSSLASIGRP